ncbi:MAG TPA: flavodoxin family protein [Terracidiphilus sp.]|nr:flavodoxin family protein [Terracidiphilus sp.]
MSKSIVAIVASYRRGGTVDRAVDAILQAAREHGAETHVIHLTEQHIEFCRNCRECMQEPGEDRGKCAQDDDLEDILEEIEAADAVVLASPVNCYNVTAIFRRFMERLVGAAYWPWGAKAPVIRSKQRPRKAVLIASAGMPGFLIPLATGAPRALQLTASSLGARPIAHLWIGLAAMAPSQPLSPRTIERARRLGFNLAA